MNNNDIISFFLDDTNRKIFNWTGIENVLDIDKGRLKNCLLYQEKYFFTADEILKISNLLSSLKK